MTNTWISYKELREKLSFEDILAHYRVELKAKGDQWYGFCPLPTHEGNRRSPSFSATITKGIWQCFGCGAKGNLIEFAARMERLNPDDAGEFRKAALFLKRTFVSGGEKPRPPARAPTETDQAGGGGDDSRKEMTVIVNARLHIELKSLDYDHPYLKRRGFSECIIKAFGLGYCNRGLMKGRIAIPLHDEFGYLIGYTGRIVDDSAINENTPRYLYPGSRERNWLRYEFHKSEFLYNGYRVKGATDLVVVESFSAVWWLAEAEIINAVAVMGASVSEKQAKLITELVPEDGRVWVFANGDQAGERMAESAMKLIAPHRFVRWVKIGERKQPTDLSADEPQQILPVV
ncbi:MAG: CHC2 zinc finger domain-containing protein [Burkholderiales bacterium]